MHAQLAWGITAVGADSSPFDGTGVVIAVLDTGVARDHPAFAGIEIVEKDFTGTGNGDSHGHGTHCAGTICGRDVNGMRIGVARGVQRALVAKVLGEDGGDSHQIVSAITWAVDKGANVIAMPLGLDLQSFEAYRSNVQLFEEVAALLNAASPLRQPCMIVAAAGRKSEPHIDSGFEAAVSPPAAAHGFISVAALGQRTGGFKVADFSLRGATLSAPGVDIVSTKRNGGLTVMSGTSMAAAHAAGVAALWAQALMAQGEWNITDWAANMVANCRTTGFAHFDPASAGAGLIRAPQALR